MVKKSTLADNKSSITWRISSLVSPRPNIIPDLVNIVFVGIGDETKLEAFNFQYFGGLLFPYFENFKYKSSSIYVGDVKRVKLSYENMVLNLASGIYLKSYSFKKYKKKKEKDTKKNEKGQEKD